MDKVERCFSPLIKVRKVILLLRFGFGFPLVSTNDVLTEFKFNSCIELIRYVVFWIVFCLSNMYGFYIFYKCTKIANPIRSFQNILGNIGLSHLDTT